MVTPLGLSRLTLCVRNGHKSLILNPKCNICSQVIGLSKRDYSEVNGMLLKVYSYVDEKVRHWKDRNATTCIVVVVAL